MTNKQYELFEEKDTSVNFRVREGLKHDAVYLARKNGLTLSGYIKFLISQEVAKDKKERK